MKKTLPILCIAALFSLSACNLLFNRGGKSDKPGESSELLPSQDNPSQPGQSEPGPSNPGTSQQNPSQPSQRTDIEKAIELMNAYNYHMSYSIRVDYTYDGIPEEYLSMMDLETTMIIGPYEYDYDYPRVHITGSSEESALDEYYYINNGNFGDVTRYYKDGEGVWRTQEYSIVDENVQVKYFDQEQHNVADYFQVDGEPDTYTVNADVLDAHNYADLKLKLVKENGEISKIIVDSVVGPIYVSEEEVSVFYLSSLHAELTNFGNINVTLPQAY